jgi:acetate kinase
MSTSQSPILVIHNVSSPRKFSVFDPKSEKVLSSGLAERTGAEQGHLKLSDLEGVKHKEKLSLADHRAALLRVIEILSKDGRFDCKAIGHRVVHKAVQRNANVISVGPKAQGLRRPVNDLSKGALVDDIVCTIALTAIPATQV